MTSTSRSQYFVKPIKDLISCLVHQLYPSSVLSVAMHVSAIAPVGLVPPFKLLASHPPFVPARYYAQS